MRDRPPPPCEIPKEVSVRAGHTSVSFTLDRYGHLFPGHDTGLRDRLDAMHAEGLKGTADGAVFELRQPPSASGRPSIAFDSLGAPGRAGVVTSDRVAAAWPGQRPASFALAGRTGTRAELRATRWWSCAVQPAHQHPAPP